MNIFKINEYLTLKLEDKISHVYVNGELLNKCIQLSLNILQDEMSSFEEIDSIDE